MLTFCSSQPSMVHWLSSSIFPFCLFVCSSVRPAMVTSDQISTSTSRSYLKTCAEQTQRNSHLFRDLLAAMSGFRDIYKNNSLNWHFATIFNHGLQKFHAGRSISSNRNEQAKKKLQMNQDKWGKLSNSHHAAHTSFGRQRWISVQCSKPLCLAVCFSRFHNTTTHNTQHITHKTANNTHSTKQTTQHTQHSVGSAVRRPEPLSVSVCF